MVIVGLFALPVLVGLGVAAVLSRRSVTRARRLLVEGGAVFGSLVLGVVIAMSLWMSVYHGEP